MVNNEWRSILDPQKYVVQQTFWAKHKGTLGNTTFTLFLYLVLALGFTTVFILTHIVYPDFYGHGEGNPYLQELVSGWDYICWYMMCLLIRFHPTLVGIYCLSVNTSREYIVPLLVMLCIYSLTPKWEDHFYIHKEMRYISYALCIMYCSYYLNLLLLSMIYPVEPVVEDLMFFINNQCIQGMQFAAMMICTVCYI